jgi:adenosylcobinamide-GDP ribazoletransferase
VIGAIGFLTVLGRSSRVPSPKDVVWFPVVGALLGLVVGAAWWGAGELWPPLVAAALVVALDLALTGLLHLDGLADAADGLLPHLDRERRLAVMREPSVGAFGVGVVVAVLGVRLAAFASMAPDVLVVAGLWCAARTVMAVGLRAVPYARASGGLASAFGSGSPVPVAAVGVVLAVGLAAAGEGGPGVVAVAGGLLAGAGVVALGRSRLGGYTGDVLGAAGMVAEIVGLVVAAAEW